MNKKRQRTIQLLPRVTRLDVVLDVLDELHTVASEGRVEALAEKSDVEIMNWLRDVVYTAQETITEIEQRKVRRNEPILRVIEKQPIVLEKVK